MKKTHNILIPNMAPVQFRILAAMHGARRAIRWSCWTTAAARWRSWASNTSTTTPAIRRCWSSASSLDALDSGKYDLDHTALIITQTGGGCRASNYIHLLRKALVKAGYRPDARGQPELLRSGEGQRLSHDADHSCARLLAAIYYGDLLMTLRAQTAAL